MFPVSVSRRELEACGSDTARAERPGHRKQQGCRPSLRGGRGGLSVPPHGSSSPRRRRHARSPHRPLPSPPPRINGPRARGGRGRGGTTLSPRVANGGAAMQMSGVAWRRGAGRRRRCGGRRRSCGPGPSALRSHEVQGEPAAAGAGAGVQRLTGLSAASPAAGGRPWVRGRSLDGRRPARGSPQHPPGQAGTAVGRGERPSLPSPAPAPGLQAQSPQGRCPEGEGRGGGECQAGGGRPGAPGALPVGGEGSRVPGARLTARG